MTVERDNVSAYLTGNTPPGIHLVARYSHAWGLTHRYSNGQYICFGNSGYSSRHYHEHHTNTIRVLFGCLDVEVEGQWYRLEPNMSIGIPSGSRHRLVLVEPSTFSEVYTNVDGAPVDPREDIVRLDAGSDQHWRP